MKRICAALVAALYLFLCAPEACAAGLDPALEGSVGEQLESIGAQDLARDLPDPAKEILEELELGEINVGRLLSLSPGDFFQVIARLAMDTARRPAATLGALIGVVTLCAFIDTMKNGMRSAALSSVFSTVAILCVIASVAKPVTECILSAAQTLRDCSTFMLAFIPAFTSIITVSGAPVTATAYNLLLFTACQLISSFASGLLVPFMGVYMGLCVAGSVGSDLGVLPLAKGVRSFVTWCLSLAMTSYVGLLSMQTLVSSGADSAMMKTGKFLVGSFVPIVGGAISDALSAAQGAVHLLKASVGAFGIVAGAVLFLPSLVQVLLWYLTLKCAAFTAELLTLKKLGSLLDACSSCLATMLAMLVSFMLLIIVSIMLLLAFSKGG